MPSFLRRVGLAALAAGFTLQALPAQAEFSYLSPAQTQMYRCRKAQKDGDYAQSLQLCQGAASMFKALGDGEKRNPWYSYEVEGMALEVAAIDYAALGRHREALQTALDAHRLLTYLYHTYRMDDDDRANIATITARLARLEAAERVRI